MSTPKAAIFPTRSYQSEEAAKKAAERVAIGTAESDPNAEPALGDVTEGGLPVAEEVREREDGMRPVKVRSRTYIPPFRYGKRTYTIAANKETIIPLSVRDHLLEKGLL